MKNSKEKQKGSYLKRMGEKRSKEKQLRKVGRKSKGTLYVSYREEVRKTSNKARTEKHTQKKIIEK